MKLTNNSHENIELVKKLSVQYTDDVFIAQLTAAQAILEGGLERTSGGSQLAVKYCNLFGIKPGFIRTGTATPGVVWLPTNEFVHNVGMVKKDQPFLSNLNIEDSLKQHVELFKGLSRYSNLFNCKSFEEIASNVYEDGYATDPNYPQKLIDTYHRHDLMYLGVDAGMNLPKLIKLIGAYYFGEKPGEKPGEKKEGEE